MEWKIRTDDPLGTTVITLVAVLFMLFPASSSAGNQRWTSNGPWGGWVSCLAIDARTPTKLYAGTRGGWCFQEPRWRSKLDGDQLRPDQCPDRCPGDRLSQD